jgi:hypothetical protein
MPAYRYVYEADRILVIDPYTNIAVQAIPRWGTSQGALHIAAGSQEIWETKAHKHQLRNLL